MTEPTWYIQQQHDRESQEAAEDVVDGTMREAEVANVSDDDFEEPEDYEPDPEVEERRQIFKEVMDRHPDFAFTGDSVSDYIYNGGELESASMEDAHLEQAYEDRYIDDSDY